MKNILSVLSFLSLCAPSAFAGYGSMTLGEYATLPDCHGTIKVTESSNQGSDQVNVSLKDVVNCSNFDIVGVKNYKLGGKDRARSGSFTLPKSTLGYGFNSIQVIVKSNSGETSDTINVQFLNVTGPSYPVPSNPAPTYPVPTYPAPTGGSAY